jgi:hypothetical protein
VKPCLLGAGGYALGFALLADIADSSAVLAFVGTVVTGLLGLVSYLVRQQTVAADRAAEMSKVLVEDLRLTRKAVEEATEANRRSERVRKVFIDSMRGNQTALTAAVEGMAQVVHEGSAGREALLANQQAIQNMAGVLVGIFRDYQPKQPEEKK